MMINLESTSVAPSSISFNLIVKEQNGIINHPQDKSEIDPQFDIESYMLEKTISINQALETAVSRQPKSLSQDRIMEAVRYSLLTGVKQVRPLLCVAACELVGSAAMPAACSIEMAHTMSLIKDDLPCMDNDDLRRGQFSSHKKFGEDVPILASDALIAFAVKNVASIKGVCPDWVLRCVIELAKCVGIDGLVAGQAADLCGANDDLGLDLYQQLEFIHMHKTGALFQAAMVIGAILGGGSDEQVEKLKKYGACVGLMFQVVDDILDGTKSCEELGKTAGKDLVTEKLSYPKLIGIHKSRDLVDELRMEAQEQLDDFDQQKAAPFIALADYIAYRQN